MTPTTLSATFTDANPTAPTSDFSGTINWGDGNPATPFTSADLTANGNGNFTINASYQYAEESGATPYNITVTINDVGGGSTSDTGTTTVADAPLTHGTVSASGGVEYTTPTSLTATFTDANVNAPASDFSGTINWGDGNAATPFTSADVTANDNGSFTVSASYQYAEEGSQNIAVTINDDGGSTTTDTGSTTVADAPLTAGTVSASGGVAGLTPTTLSATFTDANRNAPTSDFSGTINWGDGTLANPDITTFGSSAVSGSGGSYTVSGSHQYAEEGPYAITVTINDVGGSTTSDSGSTTVADAPLTAGTVSATGGVALTTPTRLTATFTDANLAATSGDFSGTINWGNGDTTNFTSSAVRGSAGNYTVSASHQYAAEGSYSITVTINDDGSSTTPDTGTTTVAYSPLTLSVNAVNFTYGTALANSQLAGTASAIVSVAGTFTYTSAAGSVLNAGSGQVEAVTFTPSNTAAYTTTATTVTVNVTPEALTINAVGDSKVYDGSTSDTATPTVVGTIYNNQVIFSQAFASKDVLGSGKSTLVVSYTVSAGASGDYTVSTNTTSGTITSATVTVSAVSDRKYYDGTALSSKTPTFQVTSYNADLNETALAASTLYGSDAYSSLTQSFDSANAGSRTLSVATDNFGSNYTVVGTSTASGTINQATVTVAAVTDTKSYDGTTASAQTPIFQVSSYNADLNETALAANTLYAGDAYSSLTQSFDSANAGSRTLSVATDNFGPNYTVVGTTTASGTINQATVTVAAVSDTKSYDGTTASAQTPTFQVTSYNTDLNETALAASTLYGSDAYSSLTQSFDSANAGSRTLSVATDNFGSNYMVVGTSTAGGTINPATVSVAAVTNTKYYDGTTASAQTPTFQVTSYNVDLNETALAASTLYDVDAYSSLTQRFDSANAGNRTLSVATDNFGPNYTVVGTTTAGGTINQATVTVAAVSDTKSYDGAALSSKTPTFQVTSYNADLNETALAASTLYDSDAFTTLKQSFDSANAGSRTLTASYEYRQQLHRHQRRHGLRHDQRGDSDSGRSQRHEDLRRHDRLGQDADVPGHQLQHYTGRERTGGEHAVHQRCVHHADAKLQLPSRRQSYLDAKL